MLRPRSALRELERPVPDERGAPAPERESRPMRPELPDAVRPRRRRQGGDGARRRAAQVPALASVSRRVRSTSPADRRRSLLLQDRRPDEGGGVRRERGGQVPPRPRCRPRAPPISAAEEGRGGASLQLLAQLLARLFPRLRPPGAGAPPLSRAPR